LILARCNVFLRVKPVAHGEIKLK